MENKYILILAAIASDFLVTFSAKYMFFDVGLGQGDKIQGTIGLCMYISYLLYRFRTIRFMGETTALLIEARELLTDSDKE